MRSLGDWMKKMHEGIISSRIVLLNCPAVPLDFGYCFFYSFPARFVPCRAVSSTGLGVRSEERLQRWDIFGNWAFRNVSDPIALVALQHIHSLNEAWNAFRIQTVTELLSSLIDEIFHCFKQQFEKAKEPCKPSCVDNVDSRPATAVA